jgi:hypothetical protein
MKSGKPLLTEDSKERLLGIGLLIGIFIACLIMM